MNAISIVIVCKNEARIIGDTLKSLQGITDDIIVYDNGSTDNTISIIKNFPVQLHTGTWEGFGKTKNKATAFARYDWILSLDADEAIDETLKKSLLAFKGKDEKTIYRLRFRNYLGNKPLKYGEWGNDSHPRIYNRKTVQWDNEPVHEKLMLPPGAITSLIDGFVLHRTADDITDYAQKTVKYALLNAEKYQKQGKKSSWWKVRVSPAFTFFNYYILKAGFLDGHAGYVCAKMTAHYTFLKYARLRELNQMITDR